jgi:alcohol dehydrogenase class IV
MSVEIQPYELALPPIVRFGSGRLVEIAELVAMVGRRVWLIGGRRSLLASASRETIESSLASAGIDSRIVAVSEGEPTVAQVAAGLAGLADEDQAAAVIVAVGGGSAIDLAKAVAVLATNPPPGGLGRQKPADLEQHVVDHLEGVGRGLPIRHAPIPLVAVPTTAGTGAEATRNAVISCPERGFKKSLRSPLMVPRAALIDPDLTLGCDPSTTAAAGLDCITQLVESFICRFKKPLPRTLVLEALPRAVHALPRLLHDPGDAAARSALSHAAFVSGVALTNSGLGMAHGVAAALGIECGTAHGVACALMLPLALRVNASAAEADFAVLERSIDPLAPSDDAAAARSFVGRVEAICGAAGTPRRLSEVGLERARIGWLAENSGGASMRGNPVELGVEELQGLLAEIY